MKDYRKNFKRYLDDLAKRKPSPGGGSAVCLIFCQGVSLIEKALNYSFTKESDSFLIKNKNKRLKNHVSVVRKLRKKIYPCIDKDAYIFEKIMMARGVKRIKFIKTSENIIFSLAKACIEVFSLAKKCESDIKKSIISDFYIGRECLKVVLSGCLLNLEANSRLFKRRNSRIESLKKQAKKWK